MPTIAPPPTNNDDDCCWICLEEDTDNHGLPVTRNCACRGNSGWAHISCLATFAKVQTEKFSTDDYTHRLQHFKGTAWSVCHNCKQEFQGDIRTVLANKWVDAVASLNKISPQRIVAILNFADNLLKIDAFDVVFQTCEEVRDVLQSNKMDIDAVFLAIAEIRCLGILIQTSLLSGNKEKRREYAEQFRALNVNTGSRLPEEEIDLLFSRLLPKQAPDQDEGSNGNSITILTDLYNQAAETSGKDSTYSIKLAASVATAMLKARKFEESMVWHNEAHDRAKKVFGLNNPEYIEIKRRFLPINSRYGLRQGTLLLKDQSSKLNGRKVTILRATKDGKKYIVDIGSNMGLAEKVVKVSPTQLILAANTPVITGCDGEEFTVFVESFHKETSTYRVFAMYGIENDDKYDYLDLARSDIRVQFGPPSQRL